MPGGRPKLTDEEKARRAAEKAAKPKGKPGRPKTEGPKPEPSGRGAGRPPKSLAEKVSGLQSGTSKLKNYYKDPQFVASVRFTQGLTHILPAYIVSRLSATSATRQAVLADPDLLKDPTRSYERASRGGTMDRSLYAREAEWRSVLGTKFSWEK
jgi:hypothetical protein